MTRDKLRGRFADGTRSEVKRVALGQLQQGGPQAVSINAIARDLGVSGPALYRYFAGWDELMTELVLDAYHDLTAAVRTAVDRRRSPRSRTGAFASAYRAWAVAEPYRYRLLYRAPLPGYDAHAARLVAAAQDMMDVLLDALGARSGSRGRSVLDRQLGDWLARRGRPPSTDAREAVLAWSRLHGLVSLEIDGNFASLGVDPTPLYESEIASLTGSG